jgi:hypothetical protein
MPSPDDPNRLRAASSSRQTTTTAREPMCFSSQTTVGTPWLRKYENASAGCSSIPGRAVVSDGDIVGGR